jgi:hypothetical protein
MLRIKRSGNGEVAYTLSGRLDEKDIPELDALIRSEANGLHLVLDLNEGPNSGGPGCHQLSGALRSGQHHTEELPSIRPRVDSKISRRKLARQVLLHERRKYSAEVKRSRE